jgi:thymidylate synthase (FAD)
MRYTEFEYMRLMKLGCKPQEARSVLNNDCKTELIITGFVSD